MGTLSLYMLVSGVIQNCYLGSSQGHAKLEPSNTGVSGTKLDTWQPHTGELSGPAQGGRMAGGRQQTDGDSQAWVEGVEKTLAPLSSLLQLSQTDARREGQSAKVPPSKASEAAHTMGTRAPLPSGPVSRALFGSSATRRAEPTGEVSALPLPSEEDSRGSGAAAPVRSISLRPPGATEAPSRTWDKGMAACNGSTGHSASSGNGTGVHLSLLENRGNATRPPVTTARQKSPSASNWLPVLEKEDIPVVVGVSVSLALILIAMGVYLFRQKRKAAKGQGTSSQNPSESRRRRRYLEADAAHENRAFDVECAVDAAEQNQAQTSTSPSLPHADPTLMAEATGHPEEPPSVAANETLQAAQARAVGALLSLRQEPVHQEGHLLLVHAEPSCVPMHCKSAGPRESGARASGLCSAVFPTPQHIGTTLYCHGLEPLLRSTVPLSGDTGGNRGHSPAAGMEEGSPPGDQSSSGTARMSVTVEIHLCPEIPSALIAAQNISNSSQPETASQLPASLEGPGPRSLL